MQCLPRSCVCIVIGSSITKSLGNRMHWWKVPTWQLILAAILFVAPGVHASSTPQPCRRVNAVTHFDTATQWAWLFGQDWAKIQRCYGIRMFGYYNVHDCGWFCLRYRQPSSGHVWQVHGVNGRILYCGTILTPSMTGMIIMSLLPQLILAIRQSKTVKPRYSVKI